MWVVHDAAPEAPLHISLRGLLDGSPLWDAAVRHFVPNPARLWIDLHKRLHLTYGGAEQVYDLNAEGKNVWDPRCGFRVAATNDPLGRGEYVTTKKLLRALELV